MNNHNYTMSFKIYAIIFQVDTELPPLELCQPLELPLVTPSHPLPHSAPATFPNVISENWTLTALTKLQQQPTSITLYRSTVLYQYSHHPWPDLTLSYTYFKLTVCSSCLECIFQEVMDSLRKTVKPPLLFKPSLWSVSEKSCLLLWYKGGPTWLSRFLPESKVLDEWNFTDRKKAQVSSNAGVLLNLGSISPWRIINSARMCTIICGNFHSSH